MDRKDYIKDSLWLVICLSKAAISMSAPQWMKDADRAFFGSKKPWSVQKDLILSNYIPPYLKKILTLRQIRHLSKPVLFADIFAGKGLFDDGSAGSPLIIVSEAERVAQGRWRAVFGNLNDEMHTALKAGLSQYPDARVLNTPSEELLPLIHEHVGKRALFVFVDPYGITGYDFDLIAPLLRRVQEGLSTEVLINFMVSDFHKKSARDSVRERGFVGLDANTLSKIESIDRTLGGDWWREFQYEDSLSTEERSDLVIEGYADKLRAEGLTYIGHCPVREKDEASPNYRLIHGSRHIEALKLMNETMGNVTGGELHKRSVNDKAPLFSEQIGTPEFQEWERGRGEAIADLHDLVPRFVSGYSGQTREEIWGRIVQEHFLQFFRKEYRAVVKALRDAGKITVKTPDGQLVERGQRRGLNDDARLFPTST